MIYLAASTRMANVVRIVAKSHQVTHPWWDNLDTKTYTEWSGLSHQYVSGIRLSTTVLGIVNPYEITPGLMHELGVARGLSRQVMLINLFPAEKLLPDQFFLTDYFWSARTFEAFEHHECYLAADELDVAQAINECYSANIRNVPMGSIIPRRPL